MKKFLYWYDLHFTQISWFTIGWMSMCLLVDFGKGEWTSCVLDIALIALNYVFQRK